MTTGSAVTDVRGPWFDELRVGQSFDAGPVTLTHGLQAAHMAVVGNRQRLVLDHELATAVAGGPIASSALVWDVAIGQSTLATQHVRANLFYEGLSFARHPLIGDSLSTSTSVEALKENTRKPGREPTGLALLRIRTVDQHDRTVLDFRRCAMILLAPGAEPTGLDAEIPRRNGVEPDAGDSVFGWDLAPLLGAASSPPREGDVLRVMGGDVVSSAPELARLTGNVARVHHDAAAGGGQRLVYGGHTIGLAFHHVCQALPDLVTVLGWESCDHLAPVHEGDVLASSVAVDGVTADPSGLTRLALTVTTVRTGDDVVDVLRWRPTVLVA